MEAGTWTIVQFVEDGTINVVPSTWIQGDVCHWPPMQKNHIVAAIKNSQPLNTSWPTYDVKVFRNCTFDNYDKANAKVAEDINSLQFEMKALRKRKQDQISLSSSSDRSLDDKSSLPLLLKMKKRSKTIKMLPEDEDINDLVEKHKNPCTSRNEDVNACKSCCEKNKYLLTIIQQIHLTQELLTDVLNEVKELKDNLKLQTTEPRKQSFFKKYTELQFPLNREEDISVLENILNNDQDFEDGVQELSKIGGSNNYHFVKRVLSAIIHNDLALKYSWLGRKGKKEFYNLQIARLIICAAEKGNIADSRRQTEVSIQQWLKRASDRKGIMKNF